MDKRALLVQEFRRLDLNAAELGVPVVELMRNAGRALAAAVRRARPDGDVVLLCGKGNNGGDGYAAAAELVEAGVPLWCVAVEPPGGAASQHHRDRLPKDVVVSWRAFKAQRRGRAGLVVDCLLGSGLRGAPRPPYDAAIAWVNRQQARVLSCDVPSGWPSRTAVRPDATLTFHARKEGMTKAHCGKITVADIGIPGRAATDIGLGDLALGYPVPQRDSHKGDNGRVLVVGGGPYTGAPHYVGIGAYRAGADLVHAFIPKSAADVVRTWGPDLIVHDAGEGDRLTVAGAKAAIAALPDAHALVVGPGAGGHAETHEAVGKILAAAARHRVPTVIDADGLDAIPADYFRRNGARTVLTPHAGEFRDLAGRQATRANVEAYARRHGVTVLCKGATDVVSDGTRTRVCRRGHPAMTVGGTGDVLAGIVAALQAKGADAFDAACAASYLCKVAGEAAAEVYAWGATASDVAAAVSAVLRRLA